MVSKELILEVYKLLDLHSTQRQGFVPAFGVRSAGAAAKYSCKCSLIQVMPGYVPQPGATAQQRTGAAAAFRLQAGTKPGVGCCFLSTGQKAAATATAKMLRQQSLANIEGKTGN